MRSRLSISRRARLIALALLALAGTLTWVSVSIADDSAGAGASNPVKHIVVIYEENHSFDNLYGGWPGVNGPQRADDAHRVQVKQDGSAFNCLPQNDVNLTPSSTLSGPCSDTSPADGSPFQSHFFNAFRRPGTGDGNPFPIDSYIKPSDTTCPKHESTPPARMSFGILNGDPKGAPGGCTRDLEHRFYQEQYQINGGRQNRYTIGSDAAGLTQGTYDTRQLPVYKYLHTPGHPKYAISDEFFQGAFGGSFLNHQWLIAPRTPRHDSASETQHSIVDQNGMPATATPPNAKTTDPDVSGKGYNYVSPAAKVRDGAVTQRCSDPNNPSGSTDSNAPTKEDGHVCGDWAVNTIQPYSRPYTPGATPARLPLQHGTTIGDRLNAANRSWAWYSGGWSNADGRIGDPGWTNGTAPDPNTTSGCSDPDANKSAKYPFCPDAKFQFHHQPFNYFANYAREDSVAGANDGAGSEPDARIKSLRDEREFLDAAKASTDSCQLRDVSFVKPIGSENEHPGYSSEPNGSDHLVALLKAIEGGACAKDTMVVVAYDEFGGQWDHVSPPGQGNENGPHDAWGPGTRIPALTLTPGLRGNFAVDHAEHDTTSIMATIEHQFGLDPLGPRDTKAQDMTSVFKAEPDTSP